MDFSRMGEFSRMGTGAEIKISQLADDASYLLPNATKGEAFIVIGDNEEWAVFTWSTDATPTEVIRSSANVVFTDTDGKFCIIDSGTAVALKNRLGSAKDVLVDIASME